jgi:hypothetical protein
MTGVTLLVDQGSLQSDPEADRLHGLFRSERSRLEELYAAGEISKEEMDRQVYELRIATRRQNPVMIFARSADFDADPVKGEVALNLRGGSIHVLEPGESQVEVDLAAPGSGAEQTDAASGCGASGTRSAGVGGRREGRRGDPGGEAVEDQRQYVTISFGQMRRTEHFGQMDARESRTMQTVPELYRTMRDETQRDRDRLRAKAAILERISAHSSASCWPSSGCRWRFRRGRRANRSVFCWPSR